MQEIIPEASQLDQHFMAFVNSHGLLQGENEPVKERLQTAILVIGVDQSPVLSAPCEEWATREFGREVDDQWMAYFDLIRMRTQFFSYLFEYRIGMIHQTTYELAVSNYYMLCYQEKWHEKFDDDFEQEYWIQ